MTHDLLPDDVTTNRTLFDEPQHPPAQLYVTSDGLQLRPNRNGHPPTCIVRSQFDVRGREIGAA